MVLAQAAELNHVIDARLVGALVGIILVGFLPLVKWLGGMAVASAIGKITGVEVTVAEIKAAAEQNRGRQDEHGRKLALASANAEHAYNKAAKAETGVGELREQMVGVERDINGIAATAGMALTKAAEVDDGLSKLAVDHGKLEGRVERTEKDVEKLSDKLNG